MTADLGDLVQWQIRDEHGVVMPWFTHPALEEIRTWDLAGKRILEWGGGYSTLWWLSRGANVVTVENKKEWCDWIHARAHGNLDILCRAWDVVAADPVPFICKYNKPDIVVIDGVARVECLKAALALPRPLTIIFDNWQQDGVCMSPEAEALMEPHAEHARIYLQPDHTDHQGNPWKTAIWRLP